MKKNYPKIIFFVFLSLMLLIVFAGCRATQRTVPEQNNARNQMNSPGTSTIPNGDYSPGSTEQMDGIRTPYDAGRTPGTNDMDLSRLGTPMDRNDLRRNGTGTTGTNTRNQGNTNTTRTNIWERGNTNTARTNEQRGILGIPNANNGALDNYDNKKAQSIANILTEMEPIERATVVISGNTALVGIDIVDGYYKYSEEEYLKDELVEKIKRLAPGVTNVAITESPDLFERISRLSRDIGNGNTVQRLNDEFKNLVNRITSNIR